MKENIIELIYCVELNRFYKTATDAKKETGVDTSSILKACKGIRQSAGKHPETNEPLHWIFKEVEVNV